MCVGRPELLQARQPALRPRGRIVISGACVEPTTIEPVTAVFKEIRLRHLLAYTFELAWIPDAFDAVRDARVQGRLSVAP